jgi:hypothetical protein
MAKIIPSSIALEDARNLLNALFARRDCYRKRDGEYQYHDGLIRGLHPEISSLTKRGSDPDESIWIDNFSINDQRYLLLVLELDRVLKAQRGL